MEHIQGFEYEDGDNTYIILYELHSVLAVIWIRPNKEQRTLRLEDERKKKFIDRIKSGELTKVREGHFKRYSDCYDF